MASREFRVGADYLSALVAKLGTPFWPIKLDRILITDVSRWALSLEGMRNKLEFVKMRRRVGYWPAPFFH
jgi:hypothetical protein